MTIEMEISGGSIPGRRHVGHGPMLVGRNNQDSYGWIVTSDHVLAAVCDGCSAGLHSELGAQLGVRMLLGALERGLRGLVLEDQVAVEKLLDAVGLELLEGLGRLARELTPEGLDGDCRVKGLEPSLRETLGQVFHFTILGLVVTAELTAVFSLGDGVYAVNGEVTRIGPFPGNAPPYLVGDLVDGLGERGPMASRRRFAVNLCMPTMELESVLIGTDGVWDLFEAQLALLPTRDELLGPLDRFWTDRRFFENADALRRRLALANSLSVTFDGGIGGPRWRRGLLPDDTTLVVARRRSMVSCGHRVGRRGSSWAGRGSE